MANMEIGIVLSDTSDSSTGPGGGGSGITHNRGTGNNGYSGG